MGLGCLQGVLRLLKLLLNRIWPVAGEINLLSEMTVSRLLWEVALCWIRRLIRQKT